MYKSNKIVEKQKKRWDKYPALYAKSQAKTWLLAERVGFKPTVRLGRTPDFESGPFDHSGIFPEIGCKNIENLSTSSTLKFFYNS